ncbi:MAG: aminodeoxychorismate/anthranilate synthase component II [Planctomycetia bacterium]|nr:aminodeoxychorismate/anthranilate synthase component II [Planctomycetia bacterium]
MKTVILDNYDSFTFNLFQYVGEIDERPLVFRNDKISFAELERLNPDRIIISPGPGSPEDPNYFGICKRVILELGPRIPVLGVCLGHQGIIYAFGGRVIRAGEVMHGKTSYVFHNGNDMFQDVPRAFEAMRYHSLVGEPSSVPDCLHVTAKTWDEVIMAVRHRDFPIYGIQFHPESIGTTVGKQLLRNFLLREHASRN